MYLKENSFLGVHVAKLFAKAASEQICNSTKPWNYQTTRAGFWKCLLVISTKDKLNKTVIFFYTKTSVDICSNSSIPESLKPLQDFQISVHKKCESLIFALWTGIQSRWLRTPCRKFSGSTALGKRKPEMQLSPQVRAVNLDNGGTNNHQLMPEHFFSFCFSFKFS